MIEDERWDHAWWMPNNSGKFTVSSSWELIRHRADEKELYRLLWVKGIPFKINFFFWRLCKQRLPVGEMNRSMGFSYNGICTCCNDQVTETWDHLFVTCQKSARLWHVFSSSAGVPGPFIQLKYTIYRWWNAKCNTKLKPVYQAMPIFILWQIWKARNTVKNGGKYSYWRMEMEVNTNISLFARNRYPWLNHMPTSWPEIIQFLDQYMPPIQAQVITWSAPKQGVYKCNTDGSFKKNSGTSSCAFCIRNWEGDLTYAESRKLEEDNSLNAEVMAIRIALKHCFNNQFTPLIIETDSLIAKRVVQGTKKLTFNSFQELPTQAKTILNMDKSQMPNIRIKKFQNKEFNCSSPT
ncbi:uncharacterized protein LOC107849271 [Capsicum annuum]|uniref:uncharacterized protein LOC107849271 n=1 Tax=Capsicum annuum TaxID=4072 RepID=UPI0007BEEE97|nr:uncharacterized protein LOC107849271 [Capsicum annuum]